MAVLDLIDDGGQLAAHPAVQAGAKDLRDLVGGKPPQAELNGAGKTTLLNLLTDALSPDAGDVRLGANLMQVTLDQRRESLDPEQGLAEALTGGSADRVTSVTKAGT